MIYIPNLKEKELLIAHYFCGKTKIKATPREIYNTWNEWFKDDFRIAGQTVFKMKNGHLDYCPNPSIEKDEAVLQRYDHTFQNIYQWIKRDLDEEGHDKTYFKKELDRERNWEYGQIVRLAKQLNIFVAISKKNLYKNKLASFLLMDHGHPKRIITSGNCNSMVKCLNKKIRNKAENHLVTSEEI